MSTKDNAKLYVLSAVDRGDISVKEAATMLGRSERQTKRILKAWRTQGASALVHGNRGRRPHNALPDTTRQRVLELLLSTYSDLSNQHACSVMRRYEHLSISRSTIRRIREAAGVPNARRRPQPKPRRRRERVAQMGLLVQIDGSPHAWFGPPGVRHSLIAAIDDATGAILAACFRPEEDTNGYFLMLQAVLKNHGIPVAVYSDQHSIHRPQRRTDPSVLEQLGNASPKTQFGRCLEELGIIQMFAHSPQAKGRIERLFGTLQDRLPKELRLAGVQTLEQAHACLPGFIADFNAEFAIPPDNPVHAFRCLPDNLNWDYVFSKRHLRLVMNDNTVTYEGRYIQIPEGPTSRSYAKARVEVCLHLDDTCTVAYRGHPIAGPLRMEHLPTTRPPKQAATQPVKPPPKPPQKPSADHPWRRGRFPLRTSGHAGGNWYDA